MAEAARERIACGPRCRPLRVEREDTIWFVSCRTIEERFWLHPLIACGLAPPSRRAREHVSRLQGHARRRVKEMVREANARKSPFAPVLDAANLKRIARGLVGSALARAQRLYDVEVFALVVMSNHVHLVLRARRGNLADFMCYAKAQIAKAVNRVTGRRGPLWARRYDAQPVLDDDAAEGVTAYTLRNPVKAGLVAHHAQWPSLNLAFGVGDADELEFEYLNCTAWHRAQRPPDVERFFETTTLRLSALPHCEGMGREAYREMLESWMAKAESREATTRDAVGVETVVKAEFHARSEDPSFRKRPHAFGSPQAKAHERAMMHMLAQQHAAASLEWRSGDTSAAFPAGTYKPPLIRAA